jgi:membrane protein
MSMKLKSGFTLLKDSFAGWQEDQALTLGAALAYYTIFSLAPLLLVVIAVAGLVFGRDAVQGQVVGQIRGLVGAQGAQEVQTMIANAGKMGHGWIAALVGGGAILLGASGVFLQLQSSLDQIWGVRQRPGQGIKGLVRARFLSFGIVVGIGFLLLVSLVVSATLAALSSLTGDLGPLAHFLMEILNNVVSFGVVTLLFALIYRVLPDAEISWREVWIGAAATSLLFTIGKALLGLYLGSSSVASAYGAAGSLVIILLWVYYTTQIVFFGAELTKVYALHRGSPIQPSRGAIRISKEQPVAGPRPSSPEARPSSPPSGSASGAAPAAGSVSGWMAPLLAGVVLGAIGYGRIRGLRGARRAAGDE